VLAKNFRFLHSIGKAKTCLTDMIFFIKKVKMFHRTKC